MKRTCCYCQTKIDDGMPVPNGYDNEAAKSSCICPKCIPEAEAQLHKVIEKNRLNKLANKLKD